MTTAASSPAAEAIANRFLRQHEGGGFSAGQIVVRRRGEIPLATAVGAAHGGPFVTMATTFQVMSISKAVVGLAIALLEDRGLLNVHAPVAAVFPAFAAEGKAAITVFDVLTHRAGLLLEGIVKQPGLWSDWDGLVAAIAATRPEHPRGTLAYESHAFGWVLAEVVRRVTGRSLPEFLADEIGQELPGLDLLSAPGAPPPITAAWRGRATYMLGGVNLADGFEAVNNEVACQRALVPGAGMITTAGALAAFYETLLAGGVLPSGRRLLREETLRRYTTRQTAGRDRTTGAWVVLGRGFALGWPLPHLYGYWGSSRCYGHAGGFGCVTFADPDADLAIAILTDTHRSLGDMLRRFAPLNHRLRRL
jgi:CubicO group peptidase (beta-lactamase class C family)